MLLVGAGGIAIVTIDVLRAMGRQVDLCIDDDESISDLQGVKVVTSKRFQSDCLNRAQLDALICVGNCSVRADLAVYYSGPFGQAIHPSAIVSGSASIGHGCMVFQGAIIQAKASIGKHVIVNTGASIDHDCIIDDFVHIGPQSTLCGFVKVDRGVFIGASVTVIPGVRIGEGAYIGAGAVVVGNVPRGATYVGVPARPIRSNNN